MCVHQAQAVEAFTRAHGDLTPDLYPAMKKWREYRESHGPGPTAEESAQNWLAYRENQQRVELEKGTPGYVRHGQKAGRQLLQRRWI